MKNIRDINTFEDKIKALKELAIINMTQYAILTKKIKNNREEITNFERKSEEQLNIILESDEIDDDAKVKYMNAQIQSFYHLEDKTLDDLKEIYIATMTKDAILSGRLDKMSEEIGIQNEETYEKENDEKQEINEINKEDVYAFEKQTKINVEKLLESTDDIETKKNMLGIAIDNSKHIDHTDEEEQDYKTKIEGLSKAYFEQLTDKLDKINGINKSEKIALEILESLNLKIHESKEEQGEYKYGELVKDKIERPRVIFNNGNMAIKKMGNYITGKTTRSDENYGIIAKVDSKNIGKYKLEMLSKAGSIVSIDFFAEKELEDQLHENDSYLTTMLAAIAKAKRENRQYIGELSVIDIDDRFKTSLVEYDEKLEEKINEYIEREKIEKEQLRKEMQKTELSSNTDGRIG